MREDRLGDVVGAREVDLDIAVPELVDLPLEWGDMVEGGGVVDQDVDLAELGDYLLDDLVDLQCYVGDGIRPLSQESLPCAFAQAPSK